PLSPSVIYQGATGVLIRYRVDGDKPHSKNGWLSLFPDNAGAAFGNWKTGSKGYWFADNGTMPLTYAEQQQQERKCHEALQKAEKQRQAEQQHAAQCAADLWKQCTTANPEHPYLVKK